MSSIGPQLPPHLTKRKRTPEDDVEDATARTLPPPKATRHHANNDEDEVDWGDSDSDDDYGPSAASRPSETPSKPLTGPSLPPTSSRPMAGPTLPPGAGNTDEIDLDEDASDSDDAGPAPPPPRRVMGPTAPPASLSERPTTGPDPEDDDSDSDSDYGPALPPAVGVAPTSTAPKRPAGPQIPDTAPKRDDWMLLPPPVTDNRSDPTRIKARNFKSGRAAGAPNQGGEIGSMWTESASQRMERVLNRADTTDPSQISSSKGSLSRKAEEEAERNKAAIRQYTEQTRGKSLYSEHQNARKNGDDGRTRRKRADGVKEDDEDDDPSKRAFDREKDMAVGGRITAGKRREMLQQASNFGDRFQKGSYL